MSTTHQLTWAGRTWCVKDGTAGPRPNHWDPQNVRVDENGWLHLAISRRGGRWCCAEIATAEALGFGVYEFDLVGRPDRLDSNVVLGLFNYGSGDGREEIDIEFADFGSGPGGHYSVYPNALTATWPRSYEAASRTCVVDGATYRYVSHAFNLTLTGNYTTQRFTWLRDRVEFESLHGHRRDHLNAFGSWSFRPEDPARYIPQQPLPLRMNYWLLRGRAPAEAPEEMIVKGFRFSPA